MKRFIISAIFVFAAFATLGAQTDTTPPKSGDKPASNFEYEPIRRGDQYLRVSLGPGFSVFNIAPDGLVTDTNMNLGGSATIQYARFISSRVSMGGTIEFAFNPTLAENIYFYVPLMFNTTYEFVINRIHIPVAMNVGFALQTYNSMSYFGPILKPEVSGWYQWNQNWSFGLSTAWIAIPQYTETSEDNRTGNFVEVGLGFRYHF